MLTEASGRALAAGLDEHACRAALNRASMCFEHRQFVLAVFGLGVAGAGVRRMRDPLAAARRPVV